eukprot:scaffold402_cov21-Tisochrysis_lutea.AAC.1
MTRSPPRNQASTNLDVGAQRIAEIVHACCVSAAQALTHVATPHQDTSSSLVASETSLTPAAHLDVGAQCITDVHGLSALQLPAPRSECVGLGGQRTHGAQVDNIARQLTLHQLLHVGADLTVASSPWGGRQPKHAHIRPRGKATCIRLTMLTTPSSRAEADSTLGAGSISHHIPEAVGKCMSISAQRT